MTKSVTPEAAQAGTAAPVTYTITVNNDGLVLGKGMTVEDLGFPSYFTIGSVTATADDPTAVPTVESTDPLVVKTALLPRNATITLQVNGTASPTCATSRSRTPSSRTRPTPWIRRRATLSAGAGGREL